MKIKDKVALVTGSSSGIGRSIAVSLADEGAKVIVNSRKNEVDGNSVVSEITKKGGEAIYIKADLSEQSECKALFDSAVEKYGGIDFLVNCAGESKKGELENSDVWKYQFENILMSVVNATSEFLKVNLGKANKKIVNISSIYGSTLGGNTDFMAYSAMKAAVNNLTINLAKKHVPDVLVNAIAPGYTFTPPWGELTSELKKDLERETKIERFVDPEEIAQAVLMVLKNDAIVGQTITVDGGTLLKDLY